MFKPPSDPRSGQMRLQVHRVARQPHLALYTFNCVDFRALIAVSLVLLGFFRN
jgi:hypothetical protein